MEGLNIRVVTWRVNLAWNSKFPRHLTIHAKQHLGSKSSKQRSVSDQETCTATQWISIGKQFYAYWNSTTRLKKKKAAPYFEWKDKKNMWFKHFFVEVIWKIFKFSFILDQSQICISNGLGARACQSYLLICKNAHFSMGLQTENGNVFTLSYAISKWIKLELPDWSQMKDLFKSFLMV